MTVRSVIFDVIGRDNASKAFLSSAASADAAAKSMSGSMAKLAAVGASMTKAVTVPVLAIAAVSLKQAADFQKAQTLLQTAGGETAAQMAVISEGIKKEAIETGTSLSQLNAGMYIVAKFGSKFSATDQLLILKAAAEGAKAENVDLGVATTALTTVMQSYGLKASQAIATQNQLVVASGKSKTTMTDFAASLSNVIPLASSLGINFAQVGAAIATMTQHGESAQQSTDNLNNLIRNLAGQNNVASVAMQQLGINTLDLRKNLGTNGLTGTLQIVEDALAKSSQGGMIVVNTFKQAQLATGSLNTMIGTMTGALATQSKGLLAGTTSIKDYRTYARDLGGQAGAAALQFLALYQSSLGFNNALKSGNGNISTAAQQLQKMLGGATGLNVALMLGGTSAKTFTSDVKDISAAANKSGTDIATWAKTQSTLAVKTDQAKEKLQVLAVNLGTQLIPVASQVIGVFSDVVTWFSKLDAGTQQTIIKVALLAATIGPLILVVVKLVKTGALVVGWATAGALAMSRFAAGVVAAEISLTGMETRSYAAGLRIGSAFASMGRYIATAFKSAGVALAGIPAATAAAQGMSSKLGAVGGGALAAGAALGPLALGVVGVTAAVAVGLHFWDQYKEKQQAAAAQAAATKTMIENLTSVIAQDNDTLGANTRAYIANQLQTSGALDLAAKYHLSLSSLVNLVLNGPAGAGGASTIFDVIDKHLNENTQYGTVYSKQVRDDFNSIINSVNGLMSGTQAGLTGAKNIAAAVGKTTTAAAASVSTLGSALDKVSSKLAYSTAADTFTQSFVNLQAAVDKSSHSVDGATASAEKNRAAVLAVAQNIVDLASAQQAAGASAQDVANAMVKNVEALQVMATQLGLNHKQVDALLSAMGLTPKQISTYFDVDVKDALAKIAALQSALAAVTGGADGRGRGATNEAIAIANQIHALQAGLAQTSVTATSGTAGGGGGGTTPKISGGGAGGGASSTATALAGMTSALSAFLSSLNGTAAEVKVAFQAILTAGGKKVSGSLVDTLKTDNTKLLAEVTQRNAIATKLATAQTTLSNLVSNYSQLKAGTKSTIMGTFDVSTVQSQFTDQPTSIKTILASIQTAVANASKFSATIKALVKRHVPQGLIAQLLSAGPASLPQALALLNATPQDLATITGDYAKLTATGLDLGTYAANDFYGAGIKSAQGLVAGLKSQQTLVTKAVTNLADAMVAAIKKALKIKSPSQVFHDLGVFTGAGFINGVNSQTPHVQKALTSMVNAPTPGSQHAAWGRQGDTFHIYEQSDPVATAHAISRMRQMKARA